MRFTQCKNFNRYTGERYPKCNGGKPCQMCLMKHFSKLNKQMLQAGLDFMKSAGAIIDAR